MPVPSQMRAGVVRVRVGSRIMTSGPRVGDWKECFWGAEVEEVSLVAPAKGEYSPAEREVGMERMGIVGG